MNNIPAEAYEVARQAYDDQDIHSRGIAAALEAVWPIAIAEAEARGYQRAIDALRDDESWAKWCAQTVVAAGVQTIDIRQPNEAADYLEASAHPAIRSGESTE